jgi:SWI/SNF-related matrix-associated actin-dependent regulator of chromatin subfamily D
MIIEFNTTGVGFEPMVEWRRAVDNNEPDHNGFEIKRTIPKDQLHLNEIPIRVILRLATVAGAHGAGVVGERYKLRHDMARVLGMSGHDVARPQVITALWHYIKRNDLGDRDDKRRFVCDEALARMFNQPSFPLSDLPGLITPFLLPLDPIVLNYTIKLDNEYHQAPFAYDVTLPILQPAAFLYPNVAGNSSQSASRFVHTQQEITKYDERITRLIQTLRNSRAKREFLLEFSQDPIQFMQRWLASQSRDLEVVLGEDHVNLEARRRHDFYEQEWVGEAVLHYLHRHS